MNPTTIAPSSVGNKNSAKPALLEAHAETAKQLGYARAQEPQIKSSVQPEKMMPAKHRQTFIANHHQHQ